jgi:hypothetical protein
LKRLYRIDKSDFHRLVALLSTDLARTRQRRDNIASAIDPKVMVSVTLRFLAGAKVLPLGWPYGLAQSTVYAVIDETLASLDSRLDNIRFPTTEEECQREAACFQRLRGSPMYGFIAALDGIEVAIRCPHSGETADVRKYYIKKGFYSISVQATVSSSYRIAFLSA